MPTDGRARGGTSSGEWLLGGVSAVLALALLAFFAYQTTVRDGGPQLQAVVTDVRETSAGFEATVEVQNTGGRTAEGAQVTGEVTSGGDVVATGEASIDYIPPDSLRTATLVFPIDPLTAGRELTVAIAGYTTT